MGYYQGVLPRGITKWSTTKGEHYQGGVLSRGYYQGVLLRRYYKGEYYQGILQNGVLPRVSITKGEYYQGDITKGEICEGGISKGEYYQGVYYQGEYYQGGYYQGDLLPRGVLLRGYYQEVCTNSRGAPLVKAHFFALNLLLTTFKDGWKHFLWGKDFKLSLI